MSGTAEAARAARPRGQRRELQAVLTLTSVDGPIDAQGLEQALIDSLDALREHAAGIALGYVGGVDFATSSIELEFTVAALSPPALHARIGEIVEILETQVGFRYVGSREEATDDGPSV